MRTDNRKNCNLAVKLMIGLFCSIPLAATAVNFTYHIFAPNPGVYTIEPVTLEIEKNKYQSQAITIKAAGKPSEQKKKILHDI